MNSHRNRTRQITIAAVFSVVYFLLRSVPTFQMVGVPGRFTAGDLLLTAIAIVAGLKAGVLSVLIGTLLGYAVRPPVFFGLDFLPAILNVLLATLILTTRRKLARVVYASILSAFVMSPYSLLFGYGFVPYVWMHLFAFALLLSPITANIPAWLTHQGFRQVAGITLLALIGTMGQHLTGGLLYEGVVGFVGGIEPSKFHELWSVIFWLYPAERIIITAISTTIAVAIHRSLIRWVRYVSTSTVTQV